MRVVDKLVNRELAKWDGVTLLQKDHTSCGHLKYTLDIKGHKRPFIFSTSPGDHRGHENSRALMARTIRALGASQHVEEKRKRREQQLSQSGYVVSSGPADYNLLAVRAVQELTCDTRKPHWRLYSKEGVLVAISQTRDGIGRCMPPLSERRGMKLEPYPSLEAVQLGAGGE